jgi:integrase/recombinase XerD
MKALVPYSMVEPDAWPTPFLRFIEHRTLSDDPLAYSRAARWRPATFKQYAISLGYFLGWLQWSGRYRDDLDVVDYVTVNTVRAYVEDMRRFDLAAPTIANRLDGVRAAVSVLAPDQDARWLMAGINKLRAVHSDRRRKRERIQHTADIVAVGMSLMRNADGSDTCHPVHKAIRFRDGLILVFGALAVPRIGVLSIMALDQHLIRCGKDYRIAWSAAEMKAGQPYDAQLGPELSTLLDAYVGTFRPLLLARRPAAQGSKETGLWLSMFGKQLSSSSIYRVITKRTGAVFDESVFPHALRHGAATTLAVERPDLIDIVKPLLQHRDARSGEYYNLAGGIEASSRFGDALQERRAAIPEGRRLMRGLNGGPRRLENADRRTRSAAKGSPAATTGDRGI